MNLFRPTFCELLRNRKLFLYIIIVTIIICMLIMIIYSKNMIDLSYKNNIENSIKNRTVFVSSNKNNIETKDIKDMKHVNDIQYVLESLPIEVKGCVFTLTTNNLLDKNEIISGKEIDNDNLEVILPNQVIKEYDISNMIELKYEDISINVQVVGTYKDNLNKNRIYVSKKVINEFVKYKQELLNKKICLVEIDEYKNVENFILDIEEKGYNANIYDTSGLNDIKTYQNISIVLNIVICITILSTYVILSIIMNSIIDDEKMDLAILKTVGYKNKIIARIIFYRILIIILFSYILRNSHYFFCRNCIKK